MIDYCRYPPYYQVLKAKKECYPDQSAITVTEYNVKIDLQAILNKTAERLLLRLGNEIESRLQHGKEQHLTLYAKWGCDGASGFTEYKQRFHIDSQRDSNIFFSSFVPLRLLDSTNMEDVLWDNDRPGSSCWCRPLHLQFCAETDEVIRNECSRIGNEIDQLKPYEGWIKSSKILVSFLLFLTMIDGKCVNSLTNTSSAQRCYACKATISEFNNIEKMYTLEINEEYLNYGISSLHGWIRCFECIIHIAYRLEFKRWRKSGYETQFEAAKKSIQVSTNENAKNLFIIFFYLG